MTRYRSDAHKETRTALGAFVQKKADIDALLARLQQLSADHFEVSPDKVHWGHVGDLESHLTHLRQVSDAAFRKNEHAELVHTADL